MAEEKIENEEKDKKSEENLEENTKKRFSKKTIIQIVLIVFLSGSSITAGLISSIGLGGLGNLFSSEQNTSEEKDAEDSSSKEYKDTIINDDSVKVLELDEMVVNITGTSSSGRKTSRFLKVKVSLVYSSSDGESKITSRKAFMRDSFQDYLRQLDEKELVGTLGFTNLKVELLKRAQAIINSNEITDVLISELVVQ
mgnify:CR=1 FL=1